MIFFAIDAIDAISAADCKAADCKVADCKAADSTTDDRVDKSACVNKVDNAKTKKVHSPLMLSAKLIESATLASFG